MSDRGSVEKRPPKQPVSVADLDGKPSCPTTHGSTPAPAELSYGQTARLSNHASLVRQMEIDLLQHLNL